MTEETAVTLQPVAQIVETMTMGGAENLAVRIANALAARGHESHLIVLTEPGPLSAKIDDRVHVHYLEFWRASIRNPFYFLLSLGQGQGLITEHVRRLNLGVVQTHLPGANFWGLLLSLRGICPVLATIHNNEEFRYGEVDTRVLAHLRKRAYQMILRRCAGTVAVSDEVRTSLIRTLRAGPAEAERISVVTNGVALPEPITAGRRTGLRSEFGVDEGVPFVLAAGRFGDQKNFGDLVDAAALLKERGRSFRLVIAGDGESRPGLLARIEAEGLDSHIVLPGNLIHLDEVMQAADVFCMSSLWEGLPLVLLEAMAAGLPAAAYAIPGVSEVLQEGRTGKLAAKGDPEALADSIEGWLLDDAARTEASRAARERVAADFSFEKLVDQLEALYHLQAPGDEGA